MTAPVQKGDVLGGKFRVERVLGAGGMGVIVAAFHLQLEQLVALKFLLPEAAKDKEVVARFAREARAAAKIQSEHVARVLDVGILESGAPYMVMEYLDGEDLDAVLKRQRTLPIPEAVGYVLQACEAVAEAHALGIVHRDLKPANLFLAERTDGSRTIKVLDFGISKVLSDGSQVEDASLTRTRTVMGSPMYMSPEQLRSARDVDTRADIWSLGVILYEALGGGGPFSTGNVAEVCAAILKDAPEPLRTLRPDVPPGLEAVVERCLQKEPSKRPSNVAELVTELALYGPPGSEHSLERISRVLRRASSQRGAASRRSDRPSATDVTKSEVPLELADTKISGPVSLAPSEEPSSATPSPRAPELGATASAATVSSWGKKPPERKIPRGVLIGAGAVAGVGIIAALIASFSGGSSSSTPSTARTDPTNVTPSRPPPATVEPSSTAANASSAPSETGAIAPSARASASASPRVPSRTSPVQTVSAAASAPATASAAATAAATSAPSAAPTAQPHASDAAATSSTVAPKATASPTSTPATTPTSKPK